jgi:uncharacterized protein
MKNRWGWEHWLLTLCLIVVGARIAWAERPEDIPNPKIRDNTWVTDLTSTLRPDTIQQLNFLIEKLESETTAEMAVVVVNSLDGRDIEDYAHDLFQLWGIGKKSKDNGVLLLWSTGDRRVRIEVGYGLEGVLPDGKCGAILDNYVIPHFKAGDFDAGLLHGVQTISTVVRNEPIDIPSVTTETYEESGEFPTEALGLLGVIPVGIGSYVGYRRWRRYRKRKCPSCGAIMRRLPETEEDKLLDEIKQLEETLKSVDYDVWSCPSCSHHFTLRYPKWFSGYSECPQCHNRTCRSSEVTTRHATTMSTGQAQVTEDCEFCTYRRVYYRTIPRISTSSSSSGGSSSSGSFGGGSSGGGGASRGY